MAGEKKLFKDSKAFVYASWIFFFFPLNRKNPWLLSKPAVEINNFITEKWREVGQKNISEIKSQTLSITKRRPFYISPYYCLISPTPPQLSWYKSWRMVNRISSSTYRLQFQPPLNVNIRKKCLYWLFRLPFGMVPVTAMNFSKKKELYIFCEKNKKAKPLACI